MLGRPTITLMATENFLGKFHQIYFKQKLILFEIDKIIKSLSHCRQNNI